MVIVGVLVVMRALLIEPVRVPSDSMRPTIRAGDHVLMVKVGEPRRDDLIVFTDPDPDPDPGPDPGPERGELLLKRVVAVGGDQVGIEDGVLVVNGTPVREPYADLSGVDGLYYGPVTLSRGELFVLGDNRRDSVDSREFGPITKEAVIGRVVVRLWPYPRGL
jgi:signal peptidase I